MVLFQSSFVILCSTHGRNGKETNSSLDTFTEQTIFGFLLTIFPAHSTTKFAHLSWAKLFWYKLLLFLSSISIGLFHCAKFRKILIQSYEDAPFLALKQPICPNENFFSENLLISLVSFIHAYLHAKNQS